MVLLLLLLLYFLTMPYSMWNLSSLTRELNLYPLALETRSLSLLAREVPEGLVLNPHGAGRTEDPCEWGYFIHTSSNSVPLGLSLHLQLYMICHNLLSKQPQGQHRFQGWRRRGKVIWQKSGREGSHCWDHLWKRKSAQLPWKFNWKKQPK